MELGARAHAFFNNLGQPSEEAETKRHIDDLRLAFADVGLRNERDRNHLIKTIASAALEPFGLDQGHTQFAIAQKLIADLLDFESLFLVLTCPP